MSKSIIINFQSLWPIILNLILIILINYPSPSNKSPIFILIILIRLTLLITFKINLILYSWIPFFIFLTIIGGLIVIYIYITSLANNELFSININNFIINFIKLFLIFSIYIYINLKNNEINLFNIINSISWINTNLNFNLNLFNTLYKENYNKSTYFIIIYLYFRIICIIKICLKFKAPLRQIKF